MHSSALAIPRQDAEGMASIFNVKGFTDAKAKGFVGELCGLFIGLALFQADDTV